MSFSVDFSAVLRAYLRILLGEDREPSQGRENHEANSRFSIVDLLVPQIIAGPAAGSLRLSDLNRSRRVLNE